MLRVWEVLQRLLAGAKGLPPSARGPSEESLLSGARRYLEDNYTAYLNGVVQAHRTQVRACFVLVFRGGERHGEEGCSKLLFAAPMRFDMIARFAWELEPHPPASLGGVTRAVLCCAVLCCAVLCCAVLCCAALRCAVSGGR
jgi:hypothetical protein